MHNKCKLSKEAQNPISVGVGLVALDVVINGKDNQRPRLWAGGSCGNVVTILSYLGWLSYPIAYIGKDFASKIVLKDFKMWGVKTDLILTDEKASTPIVVERINNNSRLTHIFEFKCPYCGSMLPRNRPVPARLESNVMERMPTAKVFYFDRTSATAVNFAEAQKLRGALVVFEPHTVSKQKLFKKSIEIAHIVKYSGEQIEDIPFERKVSLEIKTFGAKGLKYRFRDSKGKIHKWQSMEAVRPSRLVDSAGAGDWCTAGIIHMLGQNGAEGFCRVTQEDIKNALNFGQDLAALNCVYEGARGVMYYGNRIDFESTLHSVRAKERVLLKHLCPSCKYTRRKKQE